MTYDEWIVMVEYYLLEFGINICEIPDYILNDTFNRGVSPWNILDEEIVCLLIEK